MAKEIWLWFKEQIAGLFGAAGRLIVKLWRWFTGWVRTVSGSVWRKIAVGIPVVFFLYIFVGMPFAHRIEDTMQFSYETPEGGSRSVAALVYLVDRETRTHNWTPNDPMFMPGWWLDNTPNYQKGILKALSRFSFELRDQLGRSRGSSAADKDLETASGNLAKEPGRWVVDFPTRLLPTTASDTYYREGSDQFKAYNIRLAAGNAVFERRSDNLLATLDRIALDLGASSAELEHYISENAGGFWPDTGADDLFYEVKGKVYAYTVILMALEQDFRKVIADRELASIFTELLRSLTMAATLDPTIVYNGAADGTLANHLSMQGFYLLRARTQLKEVTNILLK
ncbi:MAG: hypothetical protein COB37_03530 [Kordiimonadales bacterium]|nr:MAG: hypothetical protein COB37_03530 [Kordiimonadales bacterium]